MLAGTNRRASGSVSAFQQPLPENETLLASAWPHLIATVLLLRLPAVLNKIISTWSTRPLNIYKQFSEPKLFFHTWNLIVFVDFFLLLFLYEYLVSVKADLGSSSFVIKSLLRAGVSHRVFIELGCTRHPSWWLSRTCTALSWWPGTSGWCSSEQTQQHSQSRPCLRLSSSKKPWGTWQHFPPVQVWPGLRFVPRAVEEVPCWALRSGLQAQQTVQAVKMTLAELCTFPRVISVGLISLCVCPEARVRVLPCEGHWLKVGVWGQGFGPSWLLCQLCACPSRAASLVCQDLALRVPQNLQLQWVLCSPTGRRSTRG